MYINTSSYNLVCKSRCNYKDMPQGDNSRGINYTRQYFATELT